MKDITKYTAEIRAEAERKIKLYRLKAEALAGVKRLYKKDGSDFANIFSCFISDEAKAYGKTTAKRDNVFGEKSLGIAVFDGERCLYNEEIEIKITRGVNKLYDKDLYEELEQAGRLRDRGVGLVPCYDLTAGEVEAEILKLESDFRKRAGALEKNLDFACEKAEIINGLMSEIRLEIGEIKEAGAIDPRYTSDLWWCVSEAVEEMFREARL